MKALLLTALTLGGVASNGFATHPSTGPRPGSVAAPAMALGFGRAVAMAGDWAFVGEPNYDASARANTEGPNPPPQPGVVHVYRHLPTGWKKSADIKSPTGVPADAFGATLATDGTTLLVGQIKLAAAGGGGRGGGGGGGRGAAQAPSDTTMGQVYVYHRSADGKWNSEGRLDIASHAGSQVGAALAVSGAMALVGAPSAGDSAQGTVSLFHRGADGSWKAAANLPADGLTSGDHFGTAIAVSAERVAVGAPGYGGNGAVFIYGREKNGDLTPNASPLISVRAPAGAQVGASVALKGDRVIAGAPAATFTNAVAAATPAAFQDPAVAPGGSVGGRGANTANTPPAATPGRAGANGNRGAGTRGGGGGGIPVFGMVVIFEVNQFTGRWSDASVLTPYDFVAARFGASLATAGDELLIGAPAEEGSGRIYRVKQDKSGSISSMTKMGIDTLDGSAQFGASLAISGDAGIVGLPTDGSGGGTVAFLSKGVAGWNVSSIVYPPVLENFPSVAGKEVRCTNGKASSFECSNTGLMSYMPLSALGAKRGVHLSDLWGWNDKLTGKDYALVGRTDGLAFVDITDPVHPRYLGDLMRTKGATTSVWREIKTYKDFAFVVSDGAGPLHGIQIFDLTKLRKVPVGAPPQQFTEDAHYNSSSIHDLTINEASGYAYAVGTSAGTNNCSGGSHIIDIRDPRHPKFVACFAVPGTGRSGNGYTHDIQCVTYKGPDKRFTDHEVCIAANETHIVIQDVTDKTNMKVLSKVSYPEVAYAHQGWFNEDQSYWYEDDEMDEGGFPTNRGANGNGPNCPCGTAKGGTRTLIWDMKDLTDPILAKEYIGTTHATDHNQFVRGNRLYQSNYRAGLRILDITDPVNPREVGYFDTYPYDTDRFGGGAWGNYPWFKNGLIGVTSETEGFFLIRDRTATSVP